MGHVFESIVGADLIRAGLEIFYCREGKHEVDYVVSYQGHLLAIEVKSNRKTKASGFDQFKALYPKAQLKVVNLNNYARFSKDPLGFIAPS